MAQLVQALLADPTEGPDSSGALVRLYRVGDVFPVVVAALHDSGTPVHVYPCGGIHGLVGSDPQERRLVRHARRRREHRRVIWTDGIRPLGTSF